MASLKQLQQNFQAYMLSDDADSFSNVLSTITTAVIPPPNGVTKERLDVYRDGYAIRLIDILATDFPILVKLMGQKAFNHMAQRYVQEIHSKHFSICEYGQQLSRFLKQHHTHQSFVEMATFEWALASVSVTKSQSPLTVADLATITPESWPNLKFSFHASLTAHRFYYNIGQLWRAYNEDHQPPKKHAKKTPTLWLIWCYNNESYFCALDPQQQRLFNAIAAGLKFEEACLKLCDVMNETQAGELAGTTLRTWVEDGMIATF